MRSDTAVAALAGVALADAVPVLLRQTHRIKRLPDFPWPLFDANRVVTSRAAYPFGIPDALPAMALYLTEIGLALLGRRRSKWRARLLFGAVAAGALTGTYYLYDMVAVEKKACPYCLVALGANYAMVPFAWRLLRRRS